jgi:hypothetical protein
VESINRHARSGCSNNVNFSYPQEAERLCPKSRGWLSAHLTAPGIDAGAQRGNHRKAIDSPPTRSAIIAAAGGAAGPPSRKDGGCGATAIAQAVYADEATRATNCSPTEWNSHQQHRASDRSTRTERAADRSPPPMRASDRGQLYVRADTEALMHQILSSRPTFARLRHDVCGDAPHTRTGRAQSSRIPATFRQSCLLPAEQSRRRRVFEPTPPRDLNKFFASTEWDWE